MRRRTCGLAILLCFATLTSGCVAGQPGAGTPRSPADAGEVATPKVKRITAAIRGAPIGLAHERARGLLIRVPGLDALEQLVHTGLAVSTDQGPMVAQLAEAVPTIENGLWQVFPDGRMETRWKLRAGIEWHDGVPFTTDDLLFATAVERDREVGLLRHVVYDLIDRIDATDPLTIMVGWKRPFIEADTMFSHEVGLPLPRHIVERIYLEDKTSLFSGPSWNTDFVGLGPFKVREWAADSHAVLEANGRYALGRPKIDEVEVRFIPDPNTLMANVLAGVDMSIGRALSLDQALRVGEQWREGRVAIRPYGWVTVNPQFMDPNPAILSDLRFRRAALEGVDRQQLVDSFMAGRTSVAHSFVSPDTPDYKLIEPSIRRYAHDPRRAAQALAELGYSKGSDGTLREPSGRPLSVEIRSPVQNDIHGKAMASVADDWRRLGLVVEQVPIPIPRMQDREYVAAFPGFHLVENGMDTTVRNAMRFHSTSTPLAENRFLVSGNYSRYRSPELDAFIDAYVTTIPRPERMGALSVVVGHMSEHLSTLPLIHTVTATVVANRIQNVTGKATRSTESWNAHLWDVS